MKIYNASGAEILDIQVDDSSVRYRSIMNEDSLTLNFSTTGIVTVPRGSYVDFEGVRYTLFYPENFKKNSTRDFEYTLVLHGWREALKFYKYKDISAKPYRLKFPLVAKPSDFLQLLVDVMNIHDSGWIKGDCIEADEKLISFNHEYCFDVLGRLAEEFNTEWEISGKTIHLRKVEKYKDDPLPLSYGMGDGFKTGVGRQNDGDRQPIGRLYVQGGERNIDYSEYGSLSLLLPKSATLVHDGKTYRTDPDGMYITRDGNNNTAEDSYDGSDFYPKRVGTVSHVIVVDTEKHFYDIRDTSIPAALNYRDCRIAGEKATIVFQSGALAGREFDIEQTDTDLTGYIHAERRFKIVPAELDGQIMPGGVFVPQVGDKYAIFNISMPQAYISDNATKTGVSWDMFREAVKFFAEQENDKFSFTGELDGVWSRSRWLEIGGKIVPGGHVLFSDPQFQPAGIMIRITAVKDYVNNPHKPEITLSNAPVSGSFSADMGKLEAGEVVREADKKDVIRFTKRQWRDARETMEMLQESLLNFSGSINPITVQTMQLIAGDASLQFRFVNNKTSPSPVTHNVVFNTATKVLTAAAGIIQHMTLGITSLKKTHAANEYKYWDMTAYTSPALDPDKAYYLYARCAKSGSTGTFLLSEMAIGMESIANYYHFLVGILNSEQSGDRSFATVYGFSEILPGRITTDRIVSQDGKTYFDLLNGIIGGRIKFLSSGSETDLEDWAEDIAGDIQDTQQAASDADQKAQQAIDAAAANVTDYNAKFAQVQQQIDGEISNWFYAYSPTLSNYPASDWTTTTEKDRHIGDTFTNMQPSPAPDAGKSWRFVKNGSVYSWTQIADSDAVKALQQAALAQATADGKSTTFLVQPSNYHLGDTWVLNADRTVNGTAYKQGEILTATQDSVTFVEAHWIKRVRYTDDTAVDNLEIGGRNIFAASKSGLSEITSSEEFTTNMWAANVLPNSYVKIAFLPATSYIMSYEVEIIEKFERASLAQAHAQFALYNGTTLINMGSITHSQYENSVVGDKFLVRRIFTTPSDLSGYYVIGYATRYNDPVANVLMTFRNVQIEKGNKATDWSEAQEDVQLKITEAKQVGEAAQTAAGTAQTTANSLKNFTDTAFADGIVNRSERVAIEKYLNSVNETKLTVDSSYTQVYSNAYLSGTPKTNLQTAKTALNTAYTNLVNSINTAISDNVATPAEKADVDAKYGLFNTALATYQVRLEEANNAIGKGRIDDLDYIGVNLFSDMSTSSIAAWINTSNVIAAASDSYLIAIPVQPNSVYTLSADLQGSTLCRTGYITGSTVIGSTVLSSNRDTVLPRTINTGANATYVVIQVSRSYGAAIKRTVKLEKGTRATPWVANQMDAIISKAITDKFGTTIDGGLVSAVMLVLRALDSQTVTAGISGIQGANRDNPAFWAGGTYDKAFALIQFLSKMSAGTTPGSGEYAGLAKITMLHNGAAKVGDFIIEQSGRIVMIDPATGKVRLMFSVYSLPLIADLMSGTVFNGSADIGAGSTSTSQVLSGSTSVYKTGATATFGGTTLYISANGRKPTDGITPYSYAEATLWLRRGSSRAEVIASVSVSFTEEDNLFKGNQYVIPQYSFPLGSPADYTFELVVTKGGLVSGESASTLAFGFSWQFAEQNVRYQQYGLDGMMFFYSNHHFHFTEGGGLDGRAAADKWNTPGVLLSGSVLSSGATINWWGAKKHANYLVQKITGVLGTYDIYHSIGHTNYHVGLAPHANRTFYIGTKTGSTVRVYFYTNASSPALSDTAFDFQITGDNYIK